MKITKNELIEHYNFYVEDEEENGNQPLSYDEWNEEYLDDLLSVLNKMKEQRVYMIDTTFDDLDIPKFDDKRTNKIFMEISEKQGNVYSLGGFTKAFNRGEINSNTDIIRII